MTERISLTRGPVYDTVHMIGFLSTALGLLFCCCSVCVSVYKEHRGKRSLFFVDNNNDPDLHLRPLSVCDPAPEVSLMQHQEDLICWFTKKGGWTRTPVLAGGGRKEGGRKVTLPAQGEGGDGKGRVTLSWTGEEGRLRRETHYLVWSTTSLLASTP